MTYCISYHTNTPALITSTAKTLIFTDATGKVICRPGRHATLRPSIVTEADSTVVIRFPDGLTVCVDGCPDETAVTAVLNTLNTKLA